jgi:galactokinase
LNDLKLKILRAFKKNYGHNSPDILINAPGRINLIGEHTDYNNGYVLPAAIDKSFIFAFKATHTSVINLHALDIKENISFQLADLNKTSKTWLNFLKGLLKELHDGQFIIQGFDCAFSSTIPSGAGMSSSSALECGFIFGLNELFNLGLEKWQMIKMSHHSNHHYLGVKGGIMDQFSSLFGKANHCMLLDCQAFNHKYVNFSIPDYSLVLINSQITHDHVAGEYNNRPAECEEALQIIQKTFPEINSIREVKSYHLAQSHLSKTLYNRIDYVLEENQRVLEFVKYLEERNIEQLGKLLYLSHKGLKTKYEVSCKELDLLVDLTMPLEAVIGSRMMGGGFGGCTLNLIHNDQLESTISTIKELYYKNTKIESESYKVTIGDGAKILTLN